MGQNRVEGDLFVTGALGSYQFHAPDGSITNAAIQGSAGIAYTKLIPLVPITVELFGPSTSVAALTKVLHVARSAGTIVAMEAIVQTVATGADRTVTVDLRKSTGGGSYSTVLSSTIGFTDGSTAKTPVAAVVSSASYVDGDSLEAVVTVAGAAGAQAVGLALTLWLAESPN